MKAKNYFLFLSTLMCIGGFGVVSIAKSKITSSTLPEFPLSSDYNENQVPDQEEMGIIIKPTMPLPQEDIPAKKIPLSSDFNENQIPDHQEIGVPINPTIPPVQEKNSIQKVSVASDFDGTQIPDQEEIELLNQALEKRKHSKTSI